MFCCSLPFFEPLDLFTKGSQNNLFALAFEFSWVSVYSNVRFLSILDIWETGTQGFSVRTFSQPQNKARLLQTLISIAGGNHILSWLGSFYLELTGWWGFFPNYQQNEVLSWERPGVYLRKSWFSSPLGYVAYVQLNSWHSEASFPLKYG